jgi:hypothetical protein
MGCTESGIQRIEVIENKREYWPYLQELADRKWQGNKRRER